MQISDDEWAQLKENVQSLTNAIQQIEERPTSADAPTSNEGGEKKVNDPWQPSDHLKARWERQNALVQELEWQSDAGAIDLNELMRRYHEQYDRPALMLAQDLQTRASIYYNVFEALKAERDLENAAQTLKERYLTLGLIPERNRWPNPLADWLMRHALDKLNQFRQATLELLRTRGRQLLQDLNFDPTLAVAFQVSLGTNTSFAISVQAEVTATRTS